MQGYRNTILIGGIIAVIIAIAVLIWFFYDDDRPDSPDSSYLEPPSPSEIKLTYNAPDRR